MDKRNEAYMAAQVAKIDQQLMALIRVTPRTKRQAQVIEAMRYSLEAGGKRIRPLLVLEFCRMCGGEETQAMSAACALEMVHTFSLIHDDLPEMDNDDYRRGRPACHKQFGHAVALQAGDALLTAAFEVVLHDPLLSPQTQVALLRILADVTGAAGMIGGQIMDMDYETRNDVTLEALEAMVSAKTGALIRGACMMGCTAAHAPESTIALAGQYGEKLGMAFQIVDDILDVTSSSDVLGKPVGSDAEEGKTTFVTRMGLESARAQATVLTQAAEKIVQQFASHDFLLELTRELLVREK